MTKPAVFISSSTEGLEVARALSMSLEYDAFVTVWAEGVFGLGKTTLESLDAAAGKSDFAVFVFAQEDLIALRDAEQFARRSNQIFELGFLAGRLGLSRTFIVAPGGQQLHLPSDLLGIAIAHFDPRNDSNLLAALGPAAHSIRNAILKLDKRDERAIEFYSCFISYSSQDKQFAHRLYEDLQQVGVRCWLDAKDLKIGEPWREQIDRAIQIHEKILLVLSTASVKSSWVEHEITNVRRLESVSGKTLLFPVRIDDAVFETKGKAFLDLIKEKQIGDFRDWEDDKSYKRAFSRLLRDLMISTSLETKEQA